MDEFGCCLQSSIWKINLMHSRRWSRKPAAVQRLSLGPTTHVFPTSLARDTSVRACCTWRLFPCRLMGLHSVSYRTNRPREGTVAGWCGGLRLRERAAAKQWPVLLLLLSSSWTRRRTCKPLTEPPTASPAAHPGCFAGLGCLVHLSAACSPELLWGRCWKGGEGGGVRWEEALAAQPNMCCGVYSCAKMNADKTTNAPWPNAPRFVEPDSLWCVRRSSLVCPCPCTCLDAAGSAEHKCRRQGPRVGACNFNFGSRRSRSTPSPCVASHPALLSSPE